MASNSEKASFEFFVKSVEFFVKLNKRRPSLGRKGADATEKYLANRLYKVVAEGTEAEKKAVEGVLKDYPIRESKTFDENLSALAAFMVREGRFPEVYPDKDNPAYAKERRLFDFASNLFYKKSPSDSDKEKLARVMEVIMLYDIDNTCPFIAGENHDETKEQVAGFAPYEGAVRRPGRRRKEDVGIEEYDGKPSREKEKPKSGKIRRGTAREEPERVSVGVEHSEPESVPEAEPETEKANGVAESKKPEDDEGNIESCPEGVYCYLEEYRRACEKLLSGTATWKDAFTFPQYSGSMCLSVKAAYDALMSSSREERWKKGYYTYEEYVKQGKHSHEVFGLRDISPGYQLDVRSGLFRRLKLCIGDVCFTGEHGKRVDWPVLQFVVGRMEVNADRIGFESLKTVVGDMYVKNVNLASFSSLKHVYGSVDCVNCKFDVLDLVSHNLVSVDSYFPLLKVIAGDAKIFIHSAGSVNPNLVVMGELVPTTFMKMTEQGQRISRRSKTYKVYKQSISGGEGKRMKHK